MNALAAKLIVISGERRFEVEMDHLTTIGRQSDATVQLNDDQVSKYHCQIVALDGRFLLRDGQSRNGTWLRGERVMEIELCNGDEFSVGQATLRLVGGPAPATERRRRGNSRRDETAS